MRNLIIIGLTLFSFTFVNAQEKKKVEPRVKSKKVKTPHGQWTVHKKYDAQGNIIAQDSTYSYSWSSVNGKQVPPKKAQNLIQQFQQQMQQIGHTDFSNSMPNLDSLQQSFFGANNISQIQQQMQQRMQAIRQRFFQQSKQSQRFIPRKNNVPTPADSVETSPQFNTTRI